MGFFSWKILRKLRSYEKLDKLIVVIVVSIMTVVTFYWVMYTSGEKVWHPDDYIFGFIITLTIVFIIVMLAAMFKAIIIDEWWNG